MEAIFFSLKRAYHGTLRLTRHALALLGLTAARFDLLYIVEKAGGTMPQGDLRRALGVTSPTVTRMLNSLEGLGLLEREVEEEDRRRRDVVLTKSGLRCVRRAARLLIRSGLVPLAIDSALCPDRWHNEVACSMARGALDAPLGRVRDAYGDVATRDYPLIYDEDLDDLPPLPSPFAEEYG
jgi:DNA-binding MarR family transcriptional regulator